jgi:hypothetical protein
MLTFDRLFKTYQVFYGRRKNFITIRVGIKLTYSTPSLPVPLKFILVISYLLSLGFHSDPLPSRVPDAFVSGYYSTKSPIYASLSQFHNIVIFIDGYKQRCSCCAIFCSSANENCRITYAYGNFSSSTQVEP